MSFFTIKEGETIDRNKVFTIGDELPVQVIVIEEIDKQPTRPPTEPHGGPKFINLNSRFGGILPEGSIIERKYFIAQESLGVSYAGVRQDDLILVLPDNSRVADTCSNNNP